MSFLWSLRMAFGVPLILSGSMGFNFASRMRRFLVALSRMIVRPADMKLVNCYAQAKTSVSNGGAYEK
jgi:hypothetical protein